jgi:hypothetical protein
MGDGAWGIGSPAFFCVVGRKRRDVSCRVDPKRLWHEAARYDLEEKLNLRPEPNVARCFDGLVLYGNFDPAHG